MDMLAGKVKMTQQSVNTAMNPTDALERPIRLTARDVTVHYGAKQALHGMAAGEVIDVTTTDAGSVRDFQAFLRQAGHELQDLQQGETEFFFKICKAG